MSPRKSVAYVVDPDDPRAPPRDVWDRLSPEERRAVVDSLPSEYEAAAPEGDPHFEAKTQVRDVLRRYYRRIGRGVYIGAELPVYYPGEPRFAPDIMAVVDVDPHPRLRWVVTDEGRGLDLALEIHFAGDRRKDVERNVERYARLGIREYFVFEVRRARMTGFRLAPERGAYRPILPQHGLWTSEVLGLDLGMDGERLRFYHAQAPLPDADEIIARLDAAVDALTQRHADAEQRAEDEARRAEALEEELARARAELEALRRERSEDDRGGGEK